LNSQDREFAYVLDSEKRFHGIVSTDSLQALLEGSDSDKNIKEAFLDKVKPALTTDSMQVILPDVASQIWPIPVIDEQGVYQGVVSKNRFLRTLHRAEEQTN
jgi:glycine betaine/proline transport system ATP-binding protein